MGLTQIINSEYFWKYTLSTKAVFIDTGNNMWSLNLEKAETVKGN